ncbi:hypothetical protein CDD80_5814 [Ophiocordyceps camponoti-rufipedis]|uniref:C2H2-type domain-containing protein n=1 Tax=Ophiocordyceps camponoti-rufipedis TaxID=2004952 RepID=A0A2C5ZNC1_9HYPO|nr:hypothetical protein CDD80_5814 [Ophiocordyceps camponoti-rufipedis]
MSQALIASAAGEARKVRGRFQQWLAMSNLDHANRPEMTASIDNQLGRYSIWASSEICASMEDPRVHTSATHYVYMAVASLLKMLDDKIQDTADARFESSIQDIANDITLLYRLSSTALRAILARRIELGQFYTIRAGVEKPDVHRQFPTASSVLRDRFTSSFNLRWYQVLFEGYSPRSPSRLVGTTSRPKLEFDITQQGQHGLACDLDASSASSLDMGSTGSVDLNPFVCLFENCEAPKELFGHRSDWLQHMRGHTLRWRCNSKAHGLLLFDAKDDYVKHMRETHPKAFTDRQLRALAERNRRPREPIFDRCPLCGAVDLATAGSLNQLEKSYYYRIEDHLGDHLVSLALETFPGCNKVFNSTSTQEKPPTSHDKPFPSTSSSSAASQSLYYESLERKYVGKSPLSISSQEKTHVCEECQMRFRRLNDLIKHRKIHTSEKLYVCSDCDRRFTREDALSRHSQPDWSSPCAGIVASTAIESATRVVPSHQARDPCSTRPVYLSQLVSLLLFISAKSLRATENCIPVGRTHHYFGTDRVDSESYAEDCDAFEEWLVERHRLLQEACPRKYKFDLPIDFELP